MQGTIAHTLMIAFFSSIAVTLTVGSSAKAGNGEKYLLFVGTYSQGKSKGIYRMEFDPGEGKLSKPTLVAELKNPSFVAIHPSGKFLYAVNEIDNLEGKKTGGVSAYALDSATGGLKFLNQQASGGTGPCHLVVDAGGKHVLTANYGGGSVCVHPIADDGRLGKMTAFIQHKGQSINPQRQEAPHAHSINLDKDNHNAFVADLGLDKVLIYRFDQAKGSLTPNAPTHVTLKKGAGPRHFAFHPSGKTAYVINELANTINVLAYNKKTGALRSMQTITTLPKDFKGASYTAEVVVHPSGKFVYGSNRGHDSIAIFSVDGKTGKLKAEGHQGANIKTPRNFMIDPTGKFLLVGNQSSDSIAIFQINQETGALTQHGDPIEVPNPVCLRMVRRK